MTRERRWLRPLNILTTVLWVALTVWAVARNDAWVAAFGGFIAAFNLQDAIRPR